MFFDEASQGGCTLAALKNPTLHAVSLSMSQTKKGSETSAQHPGLTPSDNDLTACLSKY